MVIKALPLSKKPDISLFGFREDDKHVTLKAILDYIIKHRPGKHRTTPIMIASMTSVHHDASFNIHPSSWTIEYIDKASNSTILFMDSLGSIEEINDDANGGTRLEFWSPPVDRPRADTGDYPSLIVSFPSKEASSQFLKIIVRIRDSFS